MTLENLSVSDIVSKFGKNTTDTGSTEVQIALLTKRINHLSAHLKLFKKDNDNKQSLLTIVGKRKRLLRYLHITNLKAYRKLLKDLALRH